MTPRDVVGAAALAGLQGQNILLAGATGRNGSVVLRQLGQLGFRVRAMTRDAAGARAKFGSGHDWVEADVTRPETLVAATRGINIVISAVATARPFGVNRPEKVDYEGISNLTGAARAEGARRFVIITSSSSGAEKHFLNYIANNVLIWKGKGEAVLMDSGLEYVVIGPAAITDGAAGTREIRLIPRSGYTRGMTVDRGDLASVVIAAAGLPEAAKRTFTVHNGDGAARASWQDQFAGLPDR